MPTTLGPCPLCERELIPGRSINKHHLVPKSKGGRETYWVHVVCHGKIHAVFTNSELLKEYNSFEKIREHPDIQTFVRWIKRRPPEFRKRHARPKR